MQVNHMAEKAVIFQGICREELEKLLDCLQATSREYKKGEYIFHVGQSAPKVALVCQGSVHIIKEDYWGKCNLVTLIQPGEIFGEVYACLPECTMDVAAVAAQDSEILFLDMDRILHVCFDACTFHERLVKNVIFLLAEKNRSLSAKLDCIAPRTIRDRLLAYLSKEARVQESYLVKLPFNRQQLADYLLVDRSAMTTELYQMQREGLLCVEKNTIRLIRKQQED